MVIVPMDTETCKPSDFLLSTDGIKWRSPSAPPPPFENPMGVNTIADERGWILAASHPDIWGSAHGDVWEPLESASLPGWAMFPANGNRIVYLADAGSQSGRRARAELASPEGYEFTDELSHCDARQRTVEIRTPFHHSPTVKERASEAPRTQGNTMAPKTSEGRPFANELNSLCHNGFLSTPGRTRIPNLLIRSQTLYPIELRAHESSSMARVSGEPKPTEIILGRIRRCIRRVARTVIRQ